MKKILFLTILLIVIHFKDGSTQKFNSYGYEDYGGLFRKASHYYFYADGHEVHIPLDNVLSIETS